MRQWILRLGSSRLGGVTRNLRPWMNAVAVGSILASLSLLASACGELTAGGAAEAESFVVGDDPTSPDSSPMSAVAPTAADPSGARPSSPGGFAEAVNPFEGTVTVRLRVLLQTPGGFPLTIAGDQTVEVDIGGEAAVSLGSTSIPPGAYTGVRVVFTQVTANVTAGLGVPPLTAGVVTVDFGGAASIEKSETAPFIVQDGGKIRVTVNLRAPAWIQTVALSPAPRVVPAAAFRSFVDLTVAPE